MSRRKALAVLELGRALLEEGLHPFLLVVRREHRMERAPLEQDAFGERRLFAVFHRKDAQLRLAVGGSAIIKSRTDTVQQVAGLGAEAPLREI